jgi:uncharacterized protein YfaS (alpha-2-macroglobulin family)
VTLEDKTPLILRNSDTIVLGANVFNQTGKDMSFVVKINATNLIISEKEKKLSLKNGENIFVSFRAQTKNNTDSIQYSMVAIGDTQTNSDSVE